MVAEVIYYSTLHWEGYCFYIAATDKGLCYVGSSLNKKKHLIEWAKKVASQANLKEDHNTLSPYKAQIHAYLSGVQKEFCFDLHLLGTDFQKEVWRQLQTITYGEIRTYSDVAKEIGRPKAVRAVANALGKNPLLFVVPCHRVIHKNGDISGFSSGVDLKRKLLQIENHTELLKS